MSDGSKSERTKEREREREKVLRGERIVTFSVFGV